MKKPGRLVAMVAARVLSPRSKLATTRWWNATTLPKQLGVEDASEDDLYAAMDWLLKKQKVIENMAVEGEALYLEMRTSVDDIARLLGRSKVAAL